MKVDGLRPVPVVVVTLATVALPAGCGGGDGAGDSGGSAVTEEAARGKSAGRTSDGPLEAAGLESVAVAEADLPEYTFTVFEQGTVLGAKGKPADPAACQPMEDIRLRPPEPAPTAAAARSVRPKTDTKATDITLYAYGKAADAEEPLTRSQRGDKLHQLRGRHGPRPDRHSFPRPRPGPGRRCLRLQKGAGGNGALGSGWCAAGPMWPSSAGRAWSRTRRRARPRTR